MAIFRCNKCGYLREVANQYTGKAVNCPVCHQATPIYDTLEFIKKLLQKYVGLSAELRQLQQQLAVATAARIPEEMTETELRQLQQQMTAAIIPKGLTENAEIDLYNTTDLMSSKQYEPILTWFQKKQIQVDVDHKALDTTGFFDEVAIALGEHYDVLQAVSDRIKRTQLKGYTNVNLNISDYSQKDAERINGFCKELYEYSFVAKYFYEKREKRVHLTLQTAPAIVNFFNGEWLEWFVFMKLLAFFYEQQMRFACLRSLTLHFPNEDKYEFDVFFLINEQIPLCIECKSGEFRPFIEKYVKLRRRLNIEKTHFLLLGVGLNEEQAQGLTSMFELTFVNEKTFVQHVAALFT